MGYNFRDVSCNVCGSKESVSLGRRDPKSFVLPEHLKVNIVRCKRCGLIYPFPMPFADESQIQSNYSSPDTYFPAPLSPERMSFYRGILRGIEKILGRKGRLLDIGCGRGELLYVAGKEGWQAMGVESSLEFSEFARKRFGVNVITGKLPEVRLPEDGFDAVTLVSVLQHVYDPSCLLASIHKIISNRGVLFIETMNNNSIIYKMGDLYHKLRGRRLTTNLSPTFPSYQLYGFSRRSLEIGLDNTGFKMIKLRIEGGISRNEKIVFRGFSDAVLRRLRMILMFMAGICKQGQVLIVYARKA